MQERLKKITKRVSIWISVLVVSFSLSFCSPRVLTQYVDVPRIEKEYINHTDSVYVHDSIYVEKLLRRILSIRLNIKPRQYSNTRGILSAGLILSV